MALGAATLVQPSSAGGSSRSPSHGRFMLALRPAWASCMPAWAPCAWRKSTMRASGAMCSSFQMPRSFGVMRPSGRTAAASVKTRPAPPTARLPRWTRCQSLANPSWLEYWHIGETAMRLGKVIARKAIGENRWLMLMRFRCVRFGCSTRAPQFSVTDGSQTVDLAKLRGHVVILNFWATSCFPCIEEMPSLMALQHRMPQIVVAAISSDEDGGVYRQFLADNHVDFMTVRDPSGRIPKIYGTVKIPETYVIDSRGILRRKFVSAQNWTSPEILDYLGKL